MDKLTELLENILNEQLEQIVLSDAHNKQIAFKVKVRPVMLRQELLFQETVYRRTQVFHKNYGKAEMRERLCRMMGQATLENASAEILPVFGQAQMSAADQNATVLVSRKGKLTIKVKRRGQQVQQKSPGALEHDRMRQYILKEGVPVEFLVGLGVQSADGKVTKAKFDKFRQINRYLEFIEDVLEELPSERTIRIIDFGCGKSYLTFAMYYYLRVLQGRDIQVTGLDLKEDVIDGCNRLASQCGYDKLHFEKGDISTYAGTGQVDMVVTLHASDKQHP